MGILKSEDIQADSIHLQRKFCEAIGNNPTRYTEAGAAKALEFVKLCDEWYRMPESSMSEKQKKQTKRQALQKQLSNFLLSMGATIDRTQTK